MDINLDRIPKRKCNKGKEIKNKTRSIDWGLMALSAQIGYMVPFTSMLQLKK